MHLVHIADLDGDDHALRPVLKRLRNGRVIALHEAKPHGLVTRRAKQRVPPALEDNVQLEQGGVEVPRGVDVIRAQDRENA